MTPHLTRAGIWALATAACWFAVATIGGRPALYLIGDLLLISVAAAYARALGWGRVFESDAVALHAVIDDASVRVGVHRGDEIAIHIALEHRGAARLPRVRIVPGDASGVVFLGVAEIAGVAGGTRTEVTVHARVVRSGRWVVHGAMVEVVGGLGWVAGAAYLPLDLEVRALPSRYAVGRGATELRRRRRSMAPVGSHRARRPGFGYELRELRDYVAGDSMRHIAWRSSARQGRLMVRQFEDELVISSVIALDASSSMRGGDAGQKLEHVIDIAAACASTMFSRHDRVGVVSFDESVIGVLRPDAGAVHGRRVMQHVLGLQQLVDADRTQAGDDEVVEVVAKYLAAHQRLDFRQRSPDGPARGASPVETYDVALLERWTESRAGAAMHRYEDELRAAGLDLSGIPAPRRFAAWKGIELAPRAELRFGDKEAGLAAALREAASLSRDAMLITVITDLCGVMRIEPIIAALSVAHARRHLVAFIVPWTPDYAAPRSSPHHEVVHEAFSIAERTEREALINALRRAGATVGIVGPEQTPDSVVATLDAMRRSV